MDVRGGVGLAVALVLSGCTGEPEPAPPPPAAPASTSPAGPLADVAAVAGGMTEVVVEPAFLDALARLDLAPGVTGQGGFALASRTFSFPVTGGRLSVAADRALAGEVRHAGSGLSLTSGTSTVTLDDLVLDADAGVVTATVSVDGAERAEDTAVLAVDAADVEVSPAEGGATVVRGLRVALTAQGAEVLNAALAPEGFAPGAPVGSSTLTLEPGSG